MRIRVLAAGVVALLLLAACGGAEDPAPASAEEEAADAAPVESVGTAFLEQVVEGFDPHERVGVSDQWVGVGQETGGRVVGRQCLTEIGCSVEHCIAGIKVDDYGGEALRTGIEA